ncbi:MAG: hypothetical protein HDR51_08310 [Treponema sp.]|nr:hypothetical protein [Treponema sp.]MBD5408842.1 hypothetical protein [Treponema sp.]MBD5412729.1 hypothetical protein [Treponema sp.]MBD5414556.1 hypothetical protein [Treponema sp.]
MGCLGAVFGDTKRAKKICKTNNANTDQAQVIHYFCDEHGCLSKRISDAEFDANKERQINALNLKQKALNKLGIDEDQVKEIEPIVLVGPAYKAAEYKMKDKDGIYRYSAYQITYIFCSSDQVYVYQYTINLDKYDKKERAEEYFYKDITNFTTIDETETLPFFVHKGGCLGKSAIESINVSTSEFKIAVSGEAFLCSMIPNDETEGKIQALKAKLREKKNS